MIERFILRKLSPRGKLAFFLIQVILDLLLVFVLFYVLDYEFGAFGSAERKSVSMILYPGIFISALLSGLLCLKIWRKTDV